MRAATGWPGSRTRATPTRRSRAISCAGASGRCCEKRFPAWKQSLARAARHFSSAEAGRRRPAAEVFTNPAACARRAKRSWWRCSSSSPPAARARCIEHDGARLRVYRGKLSAEKIPSRSAFTPLEWQGEPRLALPELGGELRFRRARGKGIDASRKPLGVRLRAGGERLQPDAAAPAAHAEESVPGGRRAAVGARSAAADRLRRRPGVGSGTRRGCAIPRGGKCGPAFCRNGVKCRVNFLNNKGEEE